MRNWFQRLFDEEDDSRIEARIRPYTDKKGRKYYRFKFVVTDGDEVDTVSVSSIEDRYADPLHAKSVIRHMGFSGRVRIKL